MMASWLGQAPAFAVALALLILPGLPTALMAPARGILRLGVAIAVSCAAIVGASVIAPVFGMSWSVLPVIVVAVAVTAIAAGLKIAGRRSAAPADVVRPSGWAWIAVAAAFLSWTVLIAVAIADPSHPSQLYDGVFHINAAEFIAQTGNASPLNMTMAYPQRATSFYPNEWHAIVSLVLPVAGSAVAATNIVTVAVAALVWPVSLACLAIVLFPKHRGVSVWAPLVAFGFSFFPFGFLNWGVLYPNLLGDVLLPLSIAFVLLACRAGLAASSRILLILIALAAAGATAMGHPSALLAGVVLLAPFGLWRAVVAWRTGGRTARIVAVTSAVVGLVMIAVIWHVANVTTHEWLPSLTLAQAAGEVIFLNPGARATGILLGPLVAIGIWKTVKDRAWWILWSYGATAFFYIVASWLTVLPVRSMFVGVWYDDTTRVAALLGVFGLPLAALGATVVAGRLAGLIRQGRRLLAAALIVLLAVGAASHLLALRNEISMARNISFVFDDDSAALTPDEVALFEQADEIVGDEDVTIGDPLTGAGLFLAYTGHDVVFPHVGGSYGADADLLALDMTDGGPEVCEAAQRLGVTYAFDFGDRLLFEDYRRSFSGLHDLDEADGFTEVARVGDAALFRLTGCNP